MYCTRAFLLKEMELACFSLKKETETKRVVEEMKQYFVQNKGKKVILLLYQFKPTFLLV